MTGKFTHMISRSCKDFICPSVDDLKPYFTKEVWRLHKGDDRLYLLAERVLCGLGHSDLFYDEFKSISLRDLYNFRVEVVMFLARRLAVYSVVPQRYAHNPRHILAASINVFSGRIARFRSGHKLPFKSRYSIGKADLGCLIDEILDNDFLWEMSEKFVASYKWRLSHGRCDPI